MFWIQLGLYSLIGMFALGLAAIAIDDAMNDWL
jgi:hypothetical protein